MTRLLFALILLVALAESSAGQATITVTPDTAAIAHPGMTFTVDVLIADYEDLRGFSVQLLYNQSAIQHTSIVQGNVFSLGGGPGGLFLSSGSIASQGYILADGARIGGGGSTGDLARLFRVTFHAVGPGATNVYFGEIRLRDSGNQPLDFSTQDAVVVVSSPTPAVAFTRMYHPDSTDVAYVPMEGTLSSLRVLAAGGAPRAKVTTAMYATEPPGGTAAPFDDPDGELTRLGVVNRYWEVTSSLGYGHHAWVAFSFDQLEGSPAPAQFRLARRHLAAIGTDTWHLFPAAQTQVDLEKGMVKLEAPPEMPFGGQYALVYNDPISNEPALGGSRALILEHYPNPFAGEVTLRYHLGEPAQVELAVYDLLGRRASQIESGTRAAGWHEARWAPSDGATGLYVAVLRTPSAAVRRSMLRVR